MKFFRTVCLGTTSSPSDFQGDLFLDSEIFLYGHLSLSAHMITFYRL